MHRAGRVGVAAAGEAETFAVGLADNLGAGVEQAGHNSRIKIRHKTFESCCAVHHRHAGHHHVVLDADALAA